MSIKSTTILNLLCLCFIAGCSNSIKDEPIYYKNISLAEARKKAIRSHRALLFQSSQPKCYVCKEFETELLTNDEYGEFMKSKLVIGKISYPDSNQQWLAGMINSGAFPTYVLFNKSLEVKGLFTGNLALNQLKEYLVGIENGRSYTNLYELRDSSEKYRERYFAGLTNLFHDKAKGDSIFSKLITDEDDVRKFKEELLRHVNEIPVFYYQQLVSNVFNFLGDTAISRQYAQIALKNTKPLEIYLNNDIVNNLKPIADPNYNIDNEPYLKPETDIKNIGDVKENSLTKIAYQIKNSGKKPLVITNIFSDCSCTQATYNKEAILPGDTGTIQLTYNAGTEGKILRVLRVYSNATNNPYQFTLNGNVVK